VAVVQARMTSSRLPGKILMNIAGRPMLRYELERLRKIRLIDEIVVATTKNEADDPVADFCAGCGARVFRGSERDVLSRYYEAARAFEAGAVVRFTADCPLVDPILSERVIRHYLDHSSEVDYCSVDVKDTPRPYPRGTDTEIFSMSALTDAHGEAASAPEREHVTLFIYSRPSRYRVWRASAERDLSRYRLTVDTPEDFALVERIIEELYPVNPDFTLSDIINLLDENPALARINDSVRQKKI
jgi:spore coat polysaccharide biosynthesis protein SpsF